MSSSVMINSTPSQIIKNYGLQTGVTQKRIAKMLGVSQGLISQILNGKQPSSNVLKKILTTLSLPSDNGSELFSKLEKPKPISRYIKNHKKDNLSISIFSSSYEARSGDFLLIDDLSRNQKMLIVGDSVGHGQSANDMSFALQYGYYCIASAIDKVILSTQLVQKLLEKAYYKTEEKWVGPPSILYALFTKEDNANFYNVEFVNTGLPSPMISANIEEPALSSAVKTMTIKSGSSMFVFTDGFVSFFENPEDLRTNFLKISKAFKGDSEAILLNLIKSSKYSNSEQMLDLSFKKDDMTAVVISKIKE